MQPLLKIENLTVEFGQRSGPIQVLNGVNMTVGVGEAVGLVGESGSGKSITSLSVLRLLSEPPARITGGRIEFQGRDLLALPKSAMPAIRGRDIAMIFQEPMSSLNPVMTVEAQISEALMLHQPMSKAERRARAIELMSLVGIPDAEERLRDYPHQFSGGMRQRVMIAMALACDPKLLIADEPTTALDVTIQAQVLDLMRQLRSKLNTAVLLISHDLGVVAELCERVVVMYAGHVVEDADLASLFERPQHPYTRGLLAAVPSLTDERDRLYQIPGSVPQAGTIRKGCPFHPRCGLRRDICAEKMPPMTRRSPRHSAACWVTQETDTPAPAREAAS
ncbi:ABC transporter ATP-binding protein [Chelativorans sp. AA-79]|uniref:ABC transporter ATP-binding protein n=1 Tax=Chelativorans sp. AA-79 TaxID=3028735 RepID=UPI0023F85C52|nr:ABC transporter ATP-binding protein [Chelativorans sp. AA-79]WEX09113.1 ABC transporter ATP-binding protein [Chelativorans sp. AA-79]